MQVDPKGPETAFAHLAWEFGRTRSFFLFFFIVAHLIVMKVRWPPLRARPRCWDHAQREALPAPNSLLQGYSRNARRGRRGTVGILAGGDWNGRGTGGAAPLQRFILFIICQRLLPQRFANVLALDGRLAL